MQYYNQFGTSLLSLDKGCTEFIPPLEGCYSALFMIMYSEIFRRNVCTVAFLAMQIQRCDFLFCIYGTGFSKAVSPYVIKELRVSLVLPECRIGQRHELRDARRPSRGWNGTQQVGGRGREDVAGAPT